MWRFVVMVLLAACTKKSEPPDESAAIVEWTKFADAMCGCANKACAMDVVARKNGSTRAGLDVSDELARRKLTELRQRYAVCLAKATRPATPAAPPPMPGDAIRRKDTPTSMQADAMIREARAWAQATDAASRIASLRFAYVDRTGLLDSNFGEMSIDMGRVATEKRRVGAPTRSTDHNCYALSLAYGKWRTTQSTCSDVIDYVPHCSVTAIWNRALTRHPTIDPDAIAIVTFWTFKKTWIFEINDEPTKLSIREEFPDDCELAVEASGSGT